MKKQDVVKAWRNEEFARELTPAQRAELPQNPAGPLGLSDEDLRAVTGGWTACPTALYNTSTSC